MNYHDTPFLTSQVKRRSNGSGFRSLFDRKIIVTSNFELQSHTASPSRVRQMFPRHPWTAAQRMSDENLIIRAKGGRDSWCWRTTSFPPVFFLKFFIIFGMYMNLHYRDTSRALIKAWFRELCRVRIIGFSVKGGIILSYFISLLRMRFELLWYANSKYSPEMILDLGVQSWGMVVVHVLMKESCFSVQWFPNTYSSLRLQPIIRYHAKSREGPCCRVAQSLMWNRCQAQWKKAMIRALWVSYDGYLPCQAFS